MQMRNCSMRVSASMQTNSTCPQTYTHILVHTYTSTHTHTHTHTLTHTHTHTYTHTHTHTHTHTRTHRHTHTQTDTDNCLQLFAFCPQCQSSHFLQRPSPQRRSTCAAGKGFGVTKPSVTPSAACPCGSRKFYKDCCQPFISFAKKSAFPEELLRARLGLLVSPSLCSSCQLFTVLR